MNQLDVEIYLHIKYWKKNIKSYFSACLTLTLDIDYSAKDSERTNEIIFVDYSLGEIPQVDKSLYSLKACNF